MENQVKGPENDASEHEDDDVAKDDSEKVTVTNSEESESKENAEKESEAKEAAVAKKVDDKLKKTVVIGNQVEPSTVTAAKNEVLDGATTYRLNYTDRVNVRVRIRSPVQRYTDRFRVRVRVRVRV